MGELGGCSVFLHNGLMNILQTIFKDHYEEILYILHPRKTEVENIDKMLGGGDPSFGGAMYGCPHCSKLNFVPFRCHSRFCPTCGNKYAMVFLLSNVFGPEKGARFFFYVHYVIKIHFALFGMSDNHHRQNFYCQIFCLPL